MKRFFLFAVMFIVLALLMWNLARIGQESKEFSSVQIQWRNDRTGIFNETGLLKSWHEDGPELLWYFDDLGDGHSSVAVSNNRLYVAGMIDNQGYLFVFDLAGNLLNKINYGSEWFRNYPGTRGTPTINDGKIYIISGMGDVICLDESSLNVIWQRNMLADFDSRNIRWGIAESPLIIGDKLIVTPGGEVHNVVALNKNTGEMIWSSPGVGEPAAYCSPLYVGDLEVPLIATKTAHHIIGLEAATGKLLWSFENRNRNQIHSNTPIYADNMILFTSVDNGSTMLRLTDGGRNAEIAWKLDELDNMQGGLIKIGDYLFGSSSGVWNRLWYCVKWETGEILYTDNEFGTAGVTIYADGMLYFYSDRGEMALVKPDTEKLNIVSRFRIEKGTGPHWAHPIIYNGVLYVRHGNALMAYRIKD